MKRKKTEPATPNVACPACGEPMREKKPYLWASFVCPSCRWMVMAELAVRALLKDGLSRSEREARIKTMIAGTQLADRKELPPETLTRTQQKVLDYVRANPHDWTSNIAKGAGVTNAVGTILAGLEAAGLVAHDKCGLMKLWRTPDQKPAVFPRGTTVTVERW